MLKKKTFFSLSQFHSANGMFVWRLVNKKKKRKWFLFQLCDGYFKAIQEQRKNVSYSKFVHEIEKQ